MSETGEDGYGDGPGWIDDIYGGGRGDGFAYGDAHGSGDGFGFGDCGCGWQPEYLPIHGTDPEQ